MHIQRAVQCPSGPCPAQRVVFLGQSSARAHCSGTLVYRARFHALVQGSFSDRCDIRWVGAWAIQLLVVVFQGFQVLDPRHLLCGIHGRVRLYRHVLARRAQANRNCPHPRVRRSMGRDRMGQVLRVSGISLGAYRIQLEYRAAGNPDSGIYRCIWAVLCLGIRFGVFGRIVRSAT